LLWRDLHAVAGFWVAFFALFLLVSGLPWAKSWGGLLQQVRQRSSAAPVNQDWTTGHSSELAQRRLTTSAPGEVVAGSDQHATHHHGGAAGTGASAHQLDYRPLGSLVPRVRLEDLQPPVLIAPPSQAEASWTARSETQNRPQRAELTLDGARGTVVSRRDFSQRSLLDRAIGVGIAAHEGQLFAPLNQALGLFTAAGLWLVCISAIVMWWRRRPAGALGAPPPSSASRRPLAVGLFAIVVVLGVLLPLFGATLLIVWAVERTALRRWTAARDFLGLPPATA
jgi:uncharacterized iron-regulated membrane protein